MSDELFAVPASPMPPLAKARAAYEEAARAYEEADTDETGQLKYELLTALYNLEQLEREEMRK